MKKVLTIALIFFLPLIMKAQPYTWELGIMLGMSNYNGDLTPNSFPVLKEGHLGVNVVSKYFLNYNWAFRGTVGFGKLSGDDLNFDDEGFAYRAASFETSLFEIFAAAEWEPLGKNRYMSGNGYKKIISPYAFAGVGFTVANPKPDFSRYKGGDLTPEMQEDLGGNYFKSRVILPFGAGVKMDLEERWFVNLEFGLRGGFTDFMDGISAAGNPDNMDWYHFTTVGITHKIFK